MILKLTGFHHKELFLLDRSRFIAARAIEQRLRNESGIYVDMVGTKIWYDDVSQSNTLIVREKLEEVYAMINKTKKRKK